LPGIKEIEPHKATPTCYHSVIIFIDRLEKKLFATKAKGELVEIFIQQHQLFLCCLFLLKINHQAECNPDSVFFVGLL
jgi:hypothetical protein